MLNRHEQTTYFAKTDFRGEEKNFGIKSKDRQRHMYILGKTGMGKSTLLENMAVQDILNGNGIAFMDPHGSTVETLLEYIPEDRINDVVYFAPFDVDNPISFNILEDIGYDKRHLVVSGLMSAFKKIWEDQWSARMEYILTNTLLALVEYPDSTLLDVIPMLINKTFRKKVVEYVKDPMVKLFWVEEFAKYTDRYTQEATPAIQNKIGQFISNPLIRNIVGQSKSSFNFRDVMDNKKIVLINLSKGRMGDQNADLIGSMLVIKIYLAAMSRADLSPPEMKKLPNFYLYVDEFQSFANSTFADILSEARKYNLNLIIAHQYIEQMEESVRDAVFGNVGTMIFFRVGALDADLIEKELKPVFAANDLVDLGSYQIYVKLMIDGLTSKAFSASTLPPIDFPSQTFTKEVIEASRKSFSRPRVEVEALIKEKYGKDESKKDEPKKDFKNKPFIKNDNLVSNYKKESQSPKPSKVANKVERKQIKTNKTVSLNSLKPNNQKNISRNSKNMSDLKEVLAEALKEDNNSNEKNIIKQKEKVLENNNIKEIPEDDLRKILNTNKR